MTRRLRPEVENKLHWWGSRIGAAALLVGLLALTVLVTSRDDATNAETALWTFILFATGIGVSFYFGRQSIKDGADDLVRPQARGAARRLVTLGRGIRSLTEVINIGRAAAQKAAKDREGSVPIGHVEFVFDTLYVHVDGQLRTVIDALEDWREFEPEIVNELETERDG